MTFYLESPIFNILSRRNTCSMLWYEKVWTQFRWRQKNMAVSLTQCVAGILPKPACCEVAWRCVPASCDRSTDTTGQSGINPLMESPFLDNPRNYWTRDISWFKVRTFRKMLHDDERPQLRTLWTVVLISSVLCICLGASAHVKSYIRGITLVVFFLSNSWYL